MAKLIALGHKLSSLLAALAALAVTVPQLQPYAATITMLAGALGGVTHVAGVTAKS